MKKQFIVAAISMGYRRLKTGVFAKPVGHVALIIRPDDMTASLELHFADRTTGSTTHFDTVEYKGGDFLLWLKDNEAMWLRRSDWNTPSKFEFITKEQHIVDVFSLTND